MKEYYSHAAYIRWCRQYQYSLDNFMTQLDSVRVALGEVTWQDPEKMNIENDIYEIDEKLGEAIPRYFDNMNEPLKTSETFIENWKVLVNLLCRFCYPQFAFESIYQQEKNRIQKVHQQYKFKEKLISVTQKLDELLARHEAEMVEEAAANPTAQQAIL